jgi:hypothetical protein
MFSSSVHFIFTLNSQSRTTLFSLSLGTCEIVGADDSSDRLFSRFVSGVKS